MDNKVDSLTPEERRRRLNASVARMMASPAAPEYGGKVSPISRAAAEASMFLGKIEGRCPHCQKYNYDMSVGDNDCLRCGKTITV